MAKVKIGKKGVFSAAIKRLILPNYGQKSLRDSVITYLGSNHF